MEQVQFHCYIGENISVVIRDMATVTDANKIYGIPNKWISLLEVK